MNYSLKHLNIIIYIFWSKSILILLLIYLSLLKHFYFSYKKASIIFKKFTFFDLVVRYFIIGYCSIFFLNSIISLFIIYLPNYFNKLLYINFSIFLNRYMIFLKSTPVNIFSITIKFFHSISIFDILTIYYKSL